MSSSVKSTPIDTKREEFRKYLEKEGILESLTKALVRDTKALKSSRIWRQYLFSCFQVQLYEEPDKPSNALSYLQDRFANREVLQVENDALKKEITLLKEKVKITFGLALPQLETLLVP